MKKLFVSFSFVLGIALVVSCTKDGAAYTPSCGTTPSYANEVKPLIQSYCVSCHSNYATYSGVNTDRSRVHSTVASGEMPKGTTLSAAQKDIILCWINGGAPNN